MACPLSIYLVLGGQVMADFDNIFVYFDGWMLSALQAAVRGLEDIISEVRLRVGKPIMLTVNSRTVPVACAREVSDDELSRVIYRLCERSVYTHSREMSAGYISLRGGHRAGVSGEMGQNGMIRVKSVNIRVAHQVIGCADMIMLSMGRYADNAVIAGSPCSGKTTVLRDICRQLSLAGYSVGIVDERGEIAGGGAFDLGRGCDIMSGCQKAEGITMLLRSMSPQVIVFDEIGTAADGEAVNRSLQCGAAIITTVHADSCSAARARLQKLGVDERLCERIFVLDRDRPGTVIESSRIIGSAV